MNSLRLWLLALVSLLSSACMGVGPELALRSQDVPRLGVPKRATEPEAPPTAPPERCVVPEKEKNPAGLYSGDAWPRGRVVLTFDDGPHPGKTPRVLDLLRKHGFSATFFLVGHAIRRDTYRLVQRMVDEGHALGSHSYNHDVKMSVRNHGERSIGYIQGQHETTRILIELALVARSDEDFDSLFEAVFQEKSGTYLSAGSLRTEWQARRGRFESLLEQRGQAAGAPVYPLVYSRPPAGTPYLGLSTRDQKALYDGALARLELLNVMWHGESGDTNPTRKHELAFLTGNLAHYAKKGGVILIHDYVRTDALAMALDAMAKDPNVEVEPVDAAVRRKYGCAPLALARGRAN